MSNVCPWGALPRCSALAAPAWVSLGLSELPGLKQQVFWSKNSHVAKCSHVVCWCSESLEDIFHGMCWRSILSCLRRAKALRPHESARSGSFMHSYHHDRDLDTARYFQVQAMLSCDALCFGFLVPAMFGANKFLFASERFDPLPIRTPHRLIQVDTKTLFSSIFQWCLQPIHFQKRCKPLVLEVWTVRLPEAQNADLCLSGLFLTFPLRETEFVGLLRSLQGYGRAKLGCSFVWVPSFRANRSHFGEHKKTTTTS